jgi:HEAT repeat protein
MWQHRQNRKCLTVGIGVWAVVLTLTGLVHSAPDPLDVLERIRQLDKNLPDRAKQLEEQIKKLRISDLRKALAFKWNGDDEQWRREVGKKLAADLKQAAKSKDRNVRLAVANLIAEMGPKKVPALDMAKDSGGFARSLAPIVVSLVGDADLEVSWEALRALGTINADPALAIPEFKRVLETDGGSPASHRLAADGLKRLLLVGTHLKRASETSSQLVAVTAKELMELARQVVSAIGSTSNAAARTGLYDPDSEVRILLLEAVEATVAAYIGDFGTGTVAISPKDKDRIKSYHDRVAGINPLLQDLAGLLERKSKGKEEELLTRAIRDSDVRVQRAAINALEELGRLRTHVLKTVASLPPLEGEPAPKIDAKFNQRIEGMVLKAAPLLRSPDLSVRRSAMHFLEDLEDRAEAAVDFLIERLDDPDRFLRWAAARAIANMPAEKAVKAVPALRHVLSYPDVDVRLAAVAALVRLEHLAKDALPELEKGILQPYRDPEYRIAVMNALISIGPVNSIPAIPSLVKALKDGDVRVRRTAAEVLGRFGPLARQAVPALREALGDEDAEVRENASLAMLNILENKK